MPRRPASLADQSPAYSLALRASLRTGRKSAIYYLPIPGWRLDSAFVFVSVIVTVRTLFTPETCLDRALGGRMGGVSREANVITPITTTSPPIAVLFLIGVIMVKQITFHASRFTLHACYRFIGLPNRSYLFQPLPVAIGGAGLPLAQLSSRVAQLVEFGVPIPKVQPVTPLMARRREAGERPAVIHRH